MRELADALNTWPNAIYGHFSSKPDLHEAMVTQILNDAFDDDVVAAALDESKEWQVRFRDIGMRFFRICAEYSGIGKLLTHDGMGAASNAVALIGSMIIAMAQHGLEEKRATIVIQTALFYLACIGDLLGYYRNNERHTTAVDTLRDPVSNKFAIEMLTVLYDYDHEERAEQGLSLFIDAVSAELATKN